MTYAARTHVPVEKTRSEIEQLVKNYGAKGFVGGWHENMARVEFLCRDRHIRLTVPVSAKEQENRAKWRLLFLMVKAKLAAVDSKVVTFEQAFVGDIVMPETGKTVWESVSEPVRIAYETKKGAILLPGMSNART
jgi:hypothetical protein